MFVSLIPWNQVCVCVFDMDAKALVNHEPIDLNMETLGFQIKNKNQVLACVLTWKLEKES